MKTYQMISIPPRHAFVALFVAFASVLSAAERKPNLVLIMADDFGFECVTANGGQSYRTPNLDRLAATGMRFENCFVQPLCTPTRVELMTSISNARNYLNFGTLDPQATTFATLLKKAGYATGICGKWQLGHGTNLPQHFGFDESYLWQHTRRPPRFANPGLEHNAKELDFQNGEYGPTLVNNFALDFVARHKDHPFFLYYPMILTHDPFQPTPDSPDWDPKAKGEQVNRDVKHFADMTAYMDKMVGRLVAKLDELGLRENTLILFLGDNGTGVGVTSQFKGKSYPGGKGTRTARGTHVPMIANWPGKIASGQVNRDLIGPVDYLPTLCELGGANVPADLKIDGRSFRPQLRGQKGQPREWLYSWYARDGGAKPQWEYAMSASYKLYRDGRFFDLTADPFEEKPLAVKALSGRAAAAAQTLQTALDRYTNARPAHVAAVGENLAKKKNAEGGGKKKAGKKNP
ncbi:MAG: sulfatase-like hydrolase/transferase [Opitutaceae bacterium]|nr:sulfatase-like hydrolase/transferase [Opitutaceae bacterium]